MLNWILTHSPLFYFTQSVWRDEAFSILIAQKPVPWIIQSVNFEPPVYYTLLHYWIKVFGTSEIAVRSLSFLGFALACAVVIQWSEKIFKKSWLSFLLPILFFLNPMLLYYAFEVRTYGWYIFFATLSMYSYLERRWVLYVVATTLGFYTHTFMLVVPFVQVVHWLLTTPLPWKTPKKLLAKITKDPFFYASIVNALFIFPWIVRIMREAGRLEQSWYYPVNWHLIRSTVGNMFVGYEGTPWYLWEYTAALSVGLLLLFFLALRKKENRRLTSYFFLTVCLPLVAVIGVSFIKPLFVNRYVIPVTIGQIFLLVYAIDTLRNRVLQYSVAAVLIIFCVGFNMWYPLEHPKVDIRRTFMEINSLAGPRDVILANSPLILFESVYYSNDPDLVYLYNPSRSGFPWYVGEAIFDSEKQAYDLPPYPMRAFLIEEDGTYNIVYRTDPTATPETSPSL